MSGGTGAPSAAPWWHGCSFGCAEPASSAAQSTFFRQPTWSFLAGRWFDGAHVWNQLTGAATDDSLYSVGLKAVFDTDILQVGNTGIQFDWAHPVSSYSITNIDCNMFYIQQLQTL
ncbi:MAG TPA: hypothetical protein VN821_12455 [Candidatus Udaeobacter sp.]|nr:hypothetical protein [Candidatus Udaeobacter sp.]